MKILRMVKFEESDAQDLMRLQQWHNEMLSFFVDPDEEKSRESEGQPMMTQKTLKRASHAKVGDVIEKLSSGNILAPMDLVTAALAFAHAHARLIKRVPDVTFPQELKDRYDANMLAAYSLLEGWIRQTKDESGNIWKPE